MTNKAIGLAVYGGVSAYIGPGIFMPDLDFNPLHVGARDSSPHLYYVWLNTKSLLWVHHIICIRISLISKCVTIQSPPDMSGLDYGHDDMTTI